MKAIRTYFLITSGLVLLVFGLQAAAHAEATGSDPVAVINERSFDFNEVKEGSTVKHAFSVLNKGDQVLEIKKVKPS